MQTQAEKTDVAATAAIVAAAQEAVAAMNTYRVYVLDYRQALEPVTTICYVRAPKYGPAWKVAGKLLAGEAPSPLDGIPKFYEDADCKVEVTLPHGDGIKVAAISDLKPRNTKLDAKSLQSIMGDASLSDEDKLKAAMTALGMKVPETPAAEPEAAAAGKKK